MLPIKIWHTFGSYYKGLQHEKDNRCCQDRVHIINNNNIKGVTLADGAGSKKHSEIGAEKLTELISLDISRNFAKYYKKDINELKITLCKKIQIYLKTISGESLIDVNELGSTLLFAFTDKKNYLVGHLGDGIIGCCKNKKVSVFSEPDNEEFANITYFTTSNNIEKRIKLFKGELGEITSFILMSDGSQNSLFDLKNKKFSKAINEIINWPKYSTKKTLNKSLKNTLKNQIRHKTHDDCSIAFLVKLNYYPKDIYKKASNNLLEYISNKF